MIYPPTDPEETETALQLGTAETGLQAATTVNDTEAFKKELECATEVGRTKWSSAATRTTPP